MCKQAACPDVLIECAGLAACHVPACSGLDFALPAAALWQTVPQVVGRGFKQSVLGEFCRGGEDRGCVMSCRIFCVLHATSSLDIHIT
jgi:hypothetical protein